MRGPGAPLWRTVASLRTPEPRDRIRDVPTTRELLQATIALEKQSMALYARFAKIFYHDSALHEFWFNMARDEARHVGALDLVSTVLELEDVLDKPSPIPMRAEDIERLHALLNRYLEQPAESLGLERALRIALEVEETELEDMVGDLLRALKQNDEYQRCQRLLVHDLGELSYMIEQHCHDPVLLQRCDELVNHHAETLRHCSAGH
jgi:rubrerythrin